MDSNVPALTPPIEYPTIEVPGHGTCTVKFDLYAQYVLDSRLGMDTETLAAKLKLWLPEKDADGKIIRQGQTQLAFMLDVLAACTWDQLHLTGEQLARVFSSPKAIPEIAKAIISAFSKMQLSAGSGSQTPATETGTATLQ